MGGKLTRECFLNIYHFSGTRLHEPAIPSSRPFEALPTADHALLLQITLVPRDNFHWRLPNLTANITLLHGALALDARVFLGTIFGFDVDHVHEVGERVKG